MPANHFQEFMTDLDILKLSNVVLAGRRPYDSLDPLRVGGWNKEPSDKNITTGALFQQHSVVISRQHSLVSSVL